MIYLCKKCKRLHCEVIKITIQDVAKACNVSVATVSRVINDSGKVKENTKLLVLDTIEKMHYLPNFTGRNLRMQKTKIILILLPTIVNPFFAKLVKGMEDTARQNGYTLMMGTTYEKKEIELNHLNLLKNRLVDGVVFLDTALSKEEMNYFGKNFPVVQCSEYYSDVGVPFVSIDNEKAGYDLTRHLISLGGKRIFHISVKNNSVTTVKRLEGYKRALLEAGLPFDEENILYGNYGYHSALKLIEQRFKNNLDEVPDSIFAISDKMAAGCIKGLTNCGLNVPNDVKVVGFDNIDICMMTSPEITSISQSQYEMGVTAINMLIAKLNGKEVQQSVILNHKLIIRESAKIN